MTARKVVKRRTTGNSGSKGSDPRGGGLIFAKTAGWLLAVTAVLVGGWAAFDAMEMQVLAGRAEVAVTRFDSEIVDLPDWLPSILARKIVAKSLPEDMEIQAGVLPGGCFWVMGISPTMKGSSGRRSTKGYYLFSMRCWKPGTE